MLRLIFISLLLVNTQIQAVEVPLTKQSLPTFFKAFWKWSGTMETELIKENEVLTSCSVESGKVADATEEWQSIKLMVAGLHPLNCEKSLPKMSRFEDFKHYLPLIKESSYQNNLAWFYIDHAIMPYAMSLEFTIPRIEGTGDYVVVLSKGIFPGLTAKVRVRELKMANKKDRCLYTLETNWKGKKSNIPDLILEAFAKTAVRMSLEGLFRATSL